MDISELTDADEFTLEGNFLECKVIDVYDGDSITIIFPFGGKYWKKNCRLYGIDTPETRTRSLEEKQAGLIAKGRLCKYILDKVVWIDFRKWDKYGRLMGIIYLDKEKSVNVCEKMIEEGHAYEYFGKTKRKFSEWYTEKNFL